MKPEASGWDKPKIEILKLIGLQIDGSKHEQPRLQIEVVIDTAALGIGRENRFSANLIASVERGKINPDLVPRGGASGIRTHGQVVGAGIAPGGGISEV